MLKTLPLQTRVLMAYQFGDSSRFNGTTKNIKKMFFVWRLIISHIIRHRKFVLQGACTFLQKIYRWTEFFHKLDNIYIYTRFQKGFHRERYIDIYTCVFLHVRLCAFSTFYCPACEKTRFKDNNNNNNNNNNTLI